MGWWAALRERLSGRAPELGRAVSDLSDDTLASRLEGWLAEPTHRIWVGSPLADPRHWIEVRRGPPGTLVTPAGLAIGVTDVRAYTVAYPGGGLLDRQGPLMRSPDDVIGFESMPSASGDRALRPEQLDFTGARVAVVFGRSTDRRSRWTYSTTLVNKTNRSLRVLKFAGFQETNHGLELTTVTDAYFTEEQFIEWYGAPVNGWILPGKSATDPFNYGGPGTVWVYFLISEDGENATVAGASPDAPSR
jgi:hypothetical protein